MTEHANQVHEREMITLGMAFMGAYGLGYS